jgi:hypothetical protein
VKSYNQLARVAYAAYCKSAVNQHAANPRLFLNPPPEWLLLNAEVQLCWVAAVQAVAAEVKHIH